jgi:Pao retrotransposon peptidase.
MYRQILVHPEDRDLQRIVWKDDEHRKELAVFRLNTVTYGTASAPYLAIRTLQQLATDERHLYPVGADILDQDTYVDDILSGGADINSATTAKSQLIALLRAGGFELRKWSTNHSALIDDIPEEHRELLQTRLLGEEGFIRTLGLVWEPSTDTFAFRINLVSARQATKRTILSEVAQLYDPVGWLAPIIIVAKILLQKLWMLGVSWDDPLPLEVCQGWHQYRESLADLDPSMGRIPTRMH